MLYIVLVLLLVLYVVVVDFDVDTTVLVALVVTVLVLNAVVVLVLVLNTVLVDLDVCNPCQCPDSVIAEAAYDAFNEDRYQLQQTYCPEQSEPTSCPNCKLREPACQDESCLIK